MIRSKRMMGTGDVARFGEKRNSYRVVVMKAEGKLADDLEDLSVVLRMPLKYIFKK